MGHDPNLAARLAELASLPDHAIEPARAAFLVAASEYPNLDESHYSNRLDAMGARLKSQLPGRASPTRLIEEVNRLLFAEEGFQGNTSDYYDPRNSFLNEVMDRKLGIPITLSIVYMEVARRAGMPVYGVGLPGHFLVGLLPEKGRLFIDPFNKGKVLTERQCRDRFLAQFRGLKPPPTFLDPVWPKQIAVRLMRNLKAIYAVANEELKAFRMIQWILIFDPKSALELRERGVMYAAMGDPDRAVRDFQKYLEVAPDAADRDSILFEIQKLKQMPTRVH